MRPMNFLGTPRLGIACVMLALIWSATFTPHIAAQEPEAPTAVEATIDGKWRLHGEMSLTLARSAEPTRYADELSTGRSVHDPTGFSPPMFGIGAGYGLSEHLVLGATLAGGYENIEQEGVLGSSIENVTLEVAPYIELLMGRGTWRPFVTLSGLARAEHQHVGFAKHSRYLFGGGLSVGMHWFASDALSLTLGLRAVVARGRGDGNTPAPYPVQQIGPRGGIGDSSTPPPDTYDARVEALLLTIGLSGWL